MVSSSNVVSYLISTAVITEYVLTKSSFLELYQRHQHLLLLLHRFSLHHFVIVFFKINLDSHPSAVLLKLAQCCILSTVSNKFLDSYVLSESSLFVYSHKMIIKTCGTTTLLRMLPTLLKQTSTVLGMSLEWLGYMRKNFSFPRHQLYPHSGFHEEIVFLETQCNLHGEAYALGPLNADHWNAFVYDNCDRPMSESTDRTLNIMMYDLDPEVAINFWKKQQDIQTDTKKDTAESKDTKESSSSSPSISTTTIPTTAPSITATTTSETISKLSSLSEVDQITIKSGIRDLLPTATIQAHLFDPCGYSMNGLLFDAYYTIHVTPEKECSYVSFETNVKVTEYTSLIKNVLSTFRPKRFTMTFLVDEGGLKQMESCHPVEHSMFHISGNTPKDLSNMKYVRTARSETTFAGDYCCMMGNWTLQTIEEATLKDEMNGGKSHSPRRPRNRSF